MVSRPELLIAGFSTDEIRQRLDRGTLIRVHRGVYRVGHAAPSREATYLAAVRACGGSALLAGRAAAHLWRLLKGPPPPEVLAPTGRRVPGVMVHRARRIGGGGRKDRSVDRVQRLPDSAMHLGIPVTTAPRTLVDLASHLPASSLARACHEAGVLHGTTPAQVEAVLARRPNTPGARALRRVLHGDEPVALSELERRFLACLRKAGLPLPETNRPAGGRRVDCRWPEHRLTVELDSYRYHRSRHAWERDRAREREARARGDEFRRYTWADVAEEPGPTLEEMRAALSRGASATPPRREARPSSDRPPDPSRGRSA